jgi:predicted permease
MGLMIWYSNSNGVPVILTTTIAARLQGIDTDVAIKYVGYYCAISQSVCWTIGRAIVVADSASPQELVEDGEKRVTMMEQCWEAFKSRLFSTIGPVILGMLFGCLSEYTTPLFLNDDAPFHFLWHTLDIFAQVAVPLPGMTLGAMIYSEKFDLKSRLLSPALVSFCRLFVCPLGALLFLYFLPFDIPDVLKLVMMVEAVTPTANNVIMMLDVSNGSEIGQEVTRTMVFEYCVAVFSVTLWLSLFLHFVVTDQVEFSSMF